MKIKNPKKKKKWHEYVNEKTNHKQTIKLLIELLL